MFMFVVSAMAVTLTVPPLLGARLTTVSGTANIYGLRTPRPSLCADDDFQRIMDELDDDDDVDELDEDFLTLFCLSFSSFLRLLRVDLRSAMDCSRFLFLSVGVSKLLDQFVQG